jgi:hypothetical protein
VTALEAKRDEASDCPLCFLILRTRVDEAAALAGSRHSRHTLEEIVLASMQIDRNGTVPPAPGWLN